MSDKTTTSTFLRLGSFFKIKLVKTGCGGGTERQKMNPEIFAWEFDLISDSNKIIQHQGKFLPGLPIC